MKTVMLATFLFLASMSTCAWYIAYEAHQDRAYQNETDRAFKGAELQLWANGVHCSGS